MAGVAAGTALALVALLGSEHVHEGTSADAVDGLRPRWVARPGSVAEVQRALRFAAAHGLAVIATGAGGHLDAGGRARAADLLLSLDRLDRVLDHTAGDMTVTVEAGCPLERLQERLGEAGQWLPLDPPFGEETTVGGLVAANLSGPLRASLGTVRDLVLGLHTVAADGRLVSGGGRVVKNVAGYDLPKLHVGALGAFGVIVEATFRLRPLPAAERAVRIDVGDPSAAAELALALRDAAEPGWLEIEGDGAASAAVVYGALGDDAWVAEALGRARACAARRGLACSEPEEGEPVRAGIAARARGAAVLRGAVLPGALAEVLGPVAERAAGCHAHAANGVVRAGIRTAEEVAPALRALRPAFEERGGTLVVERATPDVKQAIEREPGLWGAPPPSAALLERLKRAFDPAGRLAPGRLPGGL